MDDIDEMVQMVAREQWKALRRGELSMWTLYHQPRDFPDGYIARQHVTKSRTTMPTHASLSGGENALGVIREILSRAGLVCLTRHPDDDPTIVEVWM